MRATLVETAESRAVAGSWVPFPSIYEINTWIWLSELSKKYGVSIDLSSVPDCEWDAIGAYGFNAVWLMGVWERSPMGTAIANQNRQLLDDFQRALPDFRPEDNVGSPYCVRRYVVDRHLGGPEGLAIAREALSKRGMNLVLDFVPNHVAPDHPWVVQHPEYFVRGNPEDAKRDPASHLQVGGMVYACGRDPYFPAWPDVLQLNVFEPGLRRAAIETVQDIAAQCDGVRCDMAMLVTNAIFERTWGQRAFPRSANEYWVEVISAVKARHPGFLFIAEAYWDMEWQLQQMGFDFCYDKRLYDRIEHSNAEDLRQHLCADFAYQRKLLRFIENHDEPRAAKAFSPAKQRAAALLMSAVPGVRLFHEGQFEGRKIRTPVFLGRRANEPADPDHQEFYAKLLHLLNRPIFHSGDFQLCTRTGWPDNPSFKNLLAISWHKDEDQFLIVINFSNSPTQARVQVPCSNAKTRIVQFTDVMSGETYERDRDELSFPGLYVALDPWAFHFFSVLM